MLPSSLVAELESESSVVVVSVSEETSSGAEVETVSPCLREDEKNNVSHDKMLTES